jgi:tetratricopeptide (TPR) repeat protein
MRRYTCLFAAAVSLLATPAEDKIERAKDAIAREPKRAEGYNALAMAFTARARETSDASYYDQALAEVEKSLALQPGNFEGMKAKTWALLGAHRFADARAIAEKLNKQAPDDLQVYGFLTDANIELGNYESAEKAAQWMLDLRPGNVPGLTRGAYLRELYGDLDGAIDFMKQAFQRTPPEETEDRAWVLTHIAHLRYLKGDIEAADRVLANALKIFPDYHYALGKLAKVRIAQKRYSEAVDLVTKRYERAPHPENLYEVGVALDKAGRRAEARETFAAFEQAARKEMNGADNANRELISYYVEYGNDVEEALRIAQREVTIRRDVHTLDVYAWALYKSGKHEEARLPIKEAIAVGVKEQEILEHARLIIQ